MTATTTKLPRIHGRTQNKIKRQWDKLQGRGNLLDYERANLLHDVWVRLQKNDSLLAKFAVEILDEFAGKHCLVFIHAAHAFDAISDEETWRQIGGKAVVLLARLNKIQRRKVIRKVKTTLKRTGRETVSQATFRTAAQAALGHEVYQSMLSEKRSGGGLKAELAILKEFLLTLIGSDPKLKRRMPRAVKKALGLDLVARRRSA